MRKVETVKGEGIDGDREERGKISKLRKIKYWFCESVEGDGRGR